jgi:putative NADPH-quinone reductase
MSPEGFNFDLYLSNADVNDYNLEAIRVPTLIVHTKDDQLASHDASRRGSSEIDQKEVSTTDGHERHWCQPRMDGGETFLVIYTVWNGAMPALLNGFLEQTFRSTFIFPDAKPGERLGFSSYFSQRKALTGKSGRVIATMQMPAFVYRWYFHPHPEKNTLRLGSIRPIRESLIGLVEAPDPRKREQWLVRMRTLGQRAQ